MRDALPPPQSVIDYVRGEKPSRTAVAAVAAGGTERRHVEFAVGAEADEIASEQAGRPRLCRLAALRGLQETTQLPVERQNASAGLRARGDKHAVDEVEARLAVRTDGRTHLTRRFHEDIIQEIEQRSRDLHTRDTVHPVKHIDDLASTAGTVSAPARMTERASSAISS